MKEEGQGSFPFFIPYYFGWIHNCFFFSFSLGCRISGGRILSIFAFSALIQHVFDWLAWV